MVIQEWHWTSIAVGCTPLTLKRLLRLADSDSLATFHRCMTTVFVRMFTALSSQIDTALASGHTFDHIYENILVRHGFIPRMKMGHINNSQFGCVYRGRWVEWKFPSVVVIRKFWDNMLQDTNRSLIEPILRNIISLLPGIHVNCDDCGWKVPESAMHSSDRCIYCSDKCVSLRCTLNTPFMARRRQTSLVK